MSPADKGDGHKVVRLRGRMHRVARLVLLAFVGPCPRGLEACHNDGDPANNRIGNLRWDTHKNNIADKFRHGTMACGEAIATAKLKLAAVAAIRRDYRDGKIKAKQLGYKKMPNGWLAQVASRHNTTPTNVGKIIRGERWHRALTRRE